MSRIPLRLLGVALVLAPPSAHATPMFTGVGDLPGGAFASVAFDVSSDGTVVVGQGESASGPEAFRWTASGGMLGLGDLPGGAFASAAAAVSADGSVVVGSSESTSGTEVAFRWTPQGGMIGFGSLPGMPATSADDVSSDGSVVVGRSYDSSMGPPDVGEAFRWTEGTGMIGLGKLAGATYSLAYAVSGDGSVVVGSSGSHSSQAFRWTAESGMVGLGPSQATYSFATDVSADGAVVVGTIDIEAFRWTAESGMVRLGFLPGGSTSYPAGVSADGTVIVGRASGAPQGDGAFIWDPAHGMRLLQQVLVEEYGLARGWLLTEATAVSADGHTIVGYGQNPDGELEAWLAVVPEPSTALLVALGLAGTAAVRRRCV